MFTRKPKPAIIVVVSEDRYDCFSYSPDPTRRDVFLMKLLSSQGGVSKNVIPGTYDFNARMELKGIRVSLTPRGSLN